MRLMKLADGVKIHEDEPKRRTQLADVRIQVADVRQLQLADVSKPCLASCSLQVGDPSVRVG